MENYSLRSLRFQGKVDDALNQLDALWGADCFEDWGTRTLPLTKGNLA